MMEPVVTWITSLNASETIALVATTFTIVGGITTFWFRGLARSRERELQSAKEQIARVENSGIAWGMTAAQTLAEAHMLVAHARTLPDGEFQRRAIETKARISALVDQGRLFFPNVSRDLVGLDRPAAMRGYRPPVLDALLLPYFELERADIADEKSLASAARNIFRARRAFISEFQDALDPRRDGLLSIVIEHHRRRTGVDDEETWDGVSGLVDDFAQRFGEDAKRMFWPEPPRPRRKILEDSARRK